ncbi:MAG: dephospho-CoA kinase [Flavobacteriales bacterium]|nr:dephospho-CoA kinase [Flavobacteriales bacterium]
MVKVGVTGGIGSGKSVVCRVLQVLGAPVFNADMEAKRCYADPEVRSAVIRAFGEGVYIGDVLDRKALADRVFNDPEDLRRLNAIIHPAVRRRFHAWADAQVAPYVVMEAAILAETGGAKAFDHVVVVSAPEDLRISRVMERDGSGEEAVRARLRNQTDEATRLALADTVIVNDDRTLVIPQVLELHRRLTTHG